MKSTRNRTSMDALRLAVFAAIACTAGSTLATSAPVPTVAGATFPATPPAPGPAPEGLDTTGDPSCCTFASLLGAPALTLPAGCAPNGLPVGMQFVGMGGEDNALLSVAAWCEAKLPRWKGLA